MEWLPPSDKVTSIYWLWDKTIRIRPENLPANIKEFYILKMHKCRRYLVLIALQWSRTAIVKSYSTFGMRCIGCRLHLWMYHKKLWYCSYTPLPSCICICTRMLSVTKSTKRLCICLAFGLVVYRLAVKFHYHVCKREAKKKENKNTWNKSNVPNVWNQSFRPRLICRPRLSI